MLLRFVITHSVLYFFIRTWLTEPGIIPKCTSSRKVITPTPNECSVRLIESRVAQRMISSLMVSINNNKPQYITVLLLSLSHL